MLEVDVSVIIPSFNSQAWIKECIESVLYDQKDIRYEIIIVDDGSSDDSVEIIQTYCDRHQNIQLYVQTHGRQGKARNTGMLKARGDYIVFLDADDVLQAGALKLFFSQAVSDQCDLVVGIAQSFNGKRTWMNEGYQSYKSKVSNTDVDRFPELLLDPSACNKMYKRSFLQGKNIQFPENTYCEDVGFIYSVYLLADKISILPEILHHYRGRKKTETPSGTQTFTAERIKQCADVYAALMDRYESVENQKIADLFKARAVIRIQRFFNRVKVYPDSTSYLHQGLREFFLKISPQMIAENANSFAIPFFMIRQGYFPHAVALLNAPNNRNALCDFFRLLSSEDSELSAEFFKEFIVYSKNKSQKKRINNKYLNKINSLMKSKDERRIQGKRIYEYALQRILRVWFFIASHLFGKKVWLIGEREGRSAEENGYIFFQYCRTQKNRDHIFYVVDKNFKRNNVNNNDHILVKGSFKYILALGKAKFAIFNNNIWDVCPKMNPSRFPDLKKIFLTHGVASYGPGVYMRGRADGFDTIVVSSQRECDLLKYEWFVSDPSKFLVSGLPRFDNLLDADAKKEILFCPTWRKSLATLDRGRFLKSSFFTTVYGLLNDPRLSRFLNAQDMTFVFRTHFNFEKFIPCFQGALSDRIRIEGSENSRKLQDAIRDARLLITDYSSILWDMAYMHRPVILFQFDREAFLAERGLHAFGTEESRMKFARMAKTREHVMGHLEHLGEAGFALTQEEAGCADGFFAYRDSNNCERLYKFLSS